MSDAGPRAPGESIVDALDELRARGCDSELRIAQGGRMVSAKGRRHAASAFGVVHVHRVEGSSDPSDAAALYAIEGPDGIRGVLVDAFGAYADPEISAALQRMKRPERGSWNPQARRTSRSEIQSIGRL
jgi:hypothetical protein